MISQDSAWFRTLLLKKRSDLKALVIKLAAFVLAGHGFRYPNFALGLALMLAFTSSSFVSASDEIAQIRIVRTVEIDETGPSNPVGLAFSSKASAFYVVSAQAGQVPGGTEVAGLTLLADRTGVVRISDVIEDPINIAYDDKVGRLLIFQASKDQLIELREGPTGVLDPRTLMRYNMGSLGLKKPQGMAMDPSSGNLFILDAAGPRLVQAQPKPDGSFSQVIVSAVNLSGVVLSKVRGLAFDPDTRHLQVMNLKQKNLYELTQTGRLVAVRDLSGFGIDMPQGMVFAPSGDQTDESGKRHLYLADSGKASLGGQDSEGTANAQYAGQILEFALAAPVAPQESNYTSTLVKTTDLSKVDPPSPDPSGLTYVPTSNTLLMSDGEVEETVNGITHFQGANVWELTLAGSVVRTANISKVNPTVVPMTDEPTGSAWNPANGHYYFSDDNAKEVYDLNPGGDKLVGTSDDTWTHFDTLAAGSGDPEGITFDPQNNHLFLLDGANMEVYEFSLTGELVSHFDVERYGVADPESVEFNPDSGTLFVLSSNPESQIIIETTTSGDLLQTIDISAAGSRKAAGLAYGPASDGSGARRFYLIDRGIDNNEDPKIVDGKMYEMTAPPFTPTVDSPPVAAKDVASTAQNTPVTIPVLANDSDQNDDLDPASANVSCLACSNPDRGKLAIYADGSFIYTPEADFLGQDGFVYEICDTTNLCDTASVSIAVQQNTSDLIFADGFESGDLSAWSLGGAGNGGLSVGEAAALAGSYGLRVSIEDGKKNFLTDETPDAEPRYRARFYFDPNSISMAEEDAVYIFEGWMDSVRVFRVELRQVSGEYELRARVNRDSAGWISSSWFTFSDTRHLVELDWWAASAVGADDGGLTMWLDGAQIANLAGIDNDTLRVYQVRLGAVAGIDKDTRGMYYFDAFESSRQNYIGP